jgi:uncharacterized RDD family membrane protein YckC/Na+-transporting methylmalonyl-CoA/oxaloacetate decarboxylase gamma subunit
MNIKSKWMLFTAAGLLATLPMAAQEPVDPAAAVAAAQNSPPAQSPAPEVQSDAADASASVKEAVVEIAEEPGTARDIVLMGRSLELKAGETAQKVVVIGGSAKIDGKVLQDAVVIMGNLEVNGAVEGSTVAVLGGIKLGPKGSVGKDAVAVAGSVALSPGSSVDGKAVSVLGKLDLPEGAVVKGDKVSLGVPVPFPGFGWLSNWIRYCLLEFRPLALQVGWVWVATGISLLLSLFVAIAFPRPVQACAEALQDRPATSFLLGLLTKLLAPIVLIVLIATGIGLVVVPFLLAALFIAALVGVTAIREWIGFRIGRRAGGGIQNPVIALLMGAAILTVLYLVPVLGLLTFLIVSVWGMGCAVTAAFGGARREACSKPARPVPASIASNPVPAGAAATPGEGGTGISSSVAANNPPPESASEPPLQSAAPASAGPARGPEPAAAALAAPPKMAGLLDYPRAGFWERMGAGFLDVVIVGILSGIVGGLPALLIPILGHMSLGLVVALAYFTGMWAWKGTTLGGIVLKLQVVRSDGGPLTFPVCLVRALTSALSVMVFFLGFLWIVFDPDKQAWHDKIAGTEVVRLPRSVPLVCL